MQSVIAIYFKLLSFKFIKSTMTHDNILLYIILLNRLFLVSHYLPNLTYTRSFRPLRDPVSKKKGGVQEQYLRNRTTVKVVNIYTGTEIEPKTFCMLSKDSSTRLYSSPHYIFY